MIGIHLFVSWEMMIIYMRMEKVATIKDNIKKKSCEGASEQITVMAVIKNLIGEEGIGLWTW